MKFINCNRESFPSYENETLQALEALEKAVPECSIEIRDMPERGWKDFILTFDGKEYDLRFDSYRKVYHIFNIFKLPAPFDRTTVYKIFETGVCGSRPEPNKMKVPRLSAVKAWIEWCDWERKQLETVGIPHFQKIYAEKWAKMEQVAKLPRIRNISSPMLVNCREFQSEYFEYTFNFSDPLYIEEKIEFKAYRLDKAQYLEFMTKILAVGL